MSRAILLCLALTLSAFALWSASSSSGSQAATGFSNRVIMIRHGEKGPQTHSVSPGSPPDSEGGRPPFPPGGGPKFPSGLNDAGRQRAQYPRTISDHAAHSSLFGNETEYDIGKIFAAPRDLPIEMERTYATVLPLAQDLRLKIDIECAESGAACVAEKVKQFALQSGQDILIAWKHRDLNVIATALGANNARQHYPDERYDVIWIMQDGAIREKRSMHCPGLDDGRVDEGDTDLEVEMAWRGYLRYWLARLPLSLKNLL